MSNRIISERVDMFLEKIDKSIAILSRRLEDSRNYLYIRANTQKFNQLESIVSSDQFRLLLFEISIPFLSLKESQISFGLYFSDLIENFHYLILTEARNKIHATIPMDAITGNFLLQKVNDQDNKKNLSYNFITKNGEIYSTEE